MTLTVGSAGLVALVAFLTLISFRRRSRMHSAADVPAGVMISIEKQAKALADRRGTERQLFHERWTVEDTPEP
jgi:hypothetical protein